MVAGRCLQKIASEILKTRDLEWRIHTRCLFSLDGSFSDFCWCPLEAEGFKQAEILKADGEKRAAILEAEGRKESAFRDAEARERLAEAEAKATTDVSNAIATGNIQAINYFVANKYIEALKDIAAAPNQKVILMPLEASNVIGALAGITELARETFGQGKSSGASDNDGSNNPTTHRGWLKWNGLMALYTGTGWY